MKFVKNVGPAPHPLPDGSDIPREGYARVPEDDRATNDAIKHGALIELTPDEFMQYSGQPVEEPSVDDLVQEAKGLGIEGAGKGKLRSRDALREAIEAKRRSDSENDDNGRE